MPSDGKHKCTNFVCDEFRRCRRLLHTLLDCAFPELLMCNTQMEQFDQKCPRVPVRMNTNSGPERRSFDGIRCEAHTSLIRDLPMYLMALPSLPLACCQSCNRLHVTRVTKLCLALVAIHVHPHNPSSLELV